ncbi:MAG: hypothetical protein JKX72_08490 [Robiginitomaculum sp.]|nr:hypothetical protein [Robiginitomaculum sp.]
MRSRFAYHVSALAILASVYSVNADASRIFSALDESTGETITIELYDLPKVETSSKNAPIINAPRIFTPNIGIASVDILSLKQAPVKIIQYAQVETQTDPPEEKIERSERPRRIPGRTVTLPKRERLFDPASVPPPRADTFPKDEIPLPDRWRLVEDIGVHERWYDPYNQNTLKGDRPLKGHDGWFFVATAISDTVLEPRSFPIPVGVQTTERPTNDLFGDPDSLVFSQTIIASGALIEGLTVFKPQDLEFRLTAAFNLNYVQVNEKRILHVEPSKGTDRTDVFVGIQEAFIDYHIRNVSDRYDFDSLRVGIQPFSTDFRGFLFQDNQPGIRFFGNRDNNRYQYNLAVFGRLEKDTNSGLNSVVSTPRRDLIFLANLYRQDFPVPGMTSQVTAVYNLNREGSHPEIDTNGFPVRPALLGNLRGRDYDVVYLGYNADGRFGRSNLTLAMYLALGQDRNSIFTGKTASIRAAMVAAEASYDYNWARFRASFLYATGDSDPYDDVETGFDAIFENPQFAGADTSYWIRQNIPFIGGGRVIGLSGRNGILNSLQSSKEQGQSNFNNPGTVLFGLGADFDILPELRLSFNANALGFADTAVLRNLRQDGSISKNIGLDLSASAIYRPKFSQNIVLRASIASLEPGEGFDDLFENEEDKKRYLSVLLNATLTY